MTVKKTAAVKSAEAANHDDELVTLPPIAFETVEDVPKTKRGGRTRTPTRFDEVVASLIPGAAKGLKFDVPVSELKQVRRDLTSAGLVLDPPVTVTMSVTENGDTATVIIAAKPKIKQNRSESTEAK